MKTKHNILPRHWIATLSALASLGLCDARGQNERRSTSEETKAGSAELRAITAAAPGTSVFQYIGRSVFVNDGKPGGHVWDVLAEADSGAVIYVLVGSESQNRLRVVSFAALERGNGVDTLRIARGGDGWDDLPSFEVAEFSDGRITLSETARRIVARHFGEVAAPEAEFFLLGMLRGRRMVTTTENVGTIRDVMIQPEKRMAVALVTPQDDFAIAGREFLVPLRALNLTARQPESITTTLKREDFERANQRAGQRPAAR